MVKRREEMVEKELKKDLKKLKIHKLEENV
jgi:hypothetical protein